MIGQDWSAGAITQLLMQLTNLVDAKEALLVKALAIVIKVSSEDKAAAVIAKAVLAELTGPLEQIKTQ